MEVKLHFPKTYKEWHEGIRHLAAVADLIEKSREGKLIGPLDYNIAMLDTDAEEEALKGAISRYDAEQKKRK